MKILKDFSLNQFRETFFLFYFLQLILEKIQSCKNKITYSEKNIKFIIDYKFITIFFPYSYFKLYQQIISFSLLPLAKRIGRKQTSDDLGGWGVYQNKQQVGVFQNSEFKYLPLKKKKKKKKKKEKRKLYFHQMTRKPSCTVSHVF